MILYYRDNVGYYKGDKEKERRFIIDGSFLGFENYKDEDIYINMYKDKLNPGDICKG